MVGLKILLYFSSLSLVGAPTAMATYNMISNENNESLEFNNLFNAIKNGAKPIDHLDKWTVDGQEFYDEDELYKYLTKKGDIQQMQTSSNPNKIFKDVGNGILDENKIYDLNENSYEKVYRDAFGNVALTKEAALKTFVNEGLVKHKYSYDNLEWFDSPKEAENDYVYKGGLKKSLYYYIQGRYYNVFNPKDKKELENYFISGYRISPSKMTGNKVVYGKKDTVANTIQNTLKRPWSISKNRPDNKKELHYTNFAEKYLKSRSFKIASSYGVLLKIHFAGGGEDEGEAETFEMSFDNKNIDLHFLKQKSNWKKTARYHKKKLGKYHYYFNHYGRLSNGQRFKSIEFWPTEFDAKNPVDVNFGNQFFEEFTKTEVKLYSDFNKRKLIYTLPIYKEVKNWTDLSTQQVYELYDRWYWNFKEDELFNNIPEEGSSSGLNEIGKPQNSYGVSKDFLYAANGQQGEQFSYNESQYQYQTYQKPKILNENEVIIDGKKFYQIQNDFLATREQVENFTYLFGKVDTRLMYTYVNEQDLSSIDGLALAQTEAEARRKMMEYESKVLMNRYFAYDVFGNFRDSAESAADAVKKMKNATALTSKYINRREIESWKGQPRSYSEIVQDGVYTIYSIRSEKANGERIYFASYSKALEAVIQGIGHSIISSTEEVVIYMYIYIDEYGDSRIFIFKNDDEIRNIVNEILK